MTPVTTIIMQAQNKVQSTLTARIASPAKRNPNILVVYHLAVLSPASAAPR